LDSLIYLEVVKHKLLKYFVFQITLTLIVGVVVRYQHNRILFPGTWAREAKVPMKLPPDGKVWKRIIGPSEKDFVEAVYLPSQGASRGVVVFAHGNAMLIDDWTELLQFYTKLLNFDVLLVEFRGYGRSGGHPTQKTIVQDFVHFYDLMTLERKSSRGLVVYHGWSIGGGIVADLARVRPPDKVILNSTLASLAQLGKDRSGLPEKIFRVLFPTEIRTLDWLQEVDKPVQIHHGRSDKVISPEHSLVLNKGLRNSELHIHEGGHGDSPQDWDTYWEQVGTFLVDETEARN